MKINLPQFFVFFIVFMSLTVVGTLSHELGHIAVARGLGYQTTLHYGSMNYYSSDLVKSIDDKLSSTKLKELLDENSTLVPSLKPKNHQLLVALGGPLQTILTGMLGLLILRFRRNRKSKSSNKFLDWMGVFLGLFWLREVFNLAMTIAMGYLNDKPNYFVGNGDEIRISDALGLPSYLIPVLFGLIGLAICLHIVFRKVPSKQRFTFILSGLFGGGIGYGMWFYVLGPVLLP